MTTKEHSYQLKTEWVGNKGTGTSDYRSYGRDVVISGNNKPNLLGSSDPAFRGDSTKYNPEELLIAALSSCHMLWFLHLCTDNGIIVTEYIDNPTGIMTLNSDSSGQMTEITLNPVVTITDKNMIEKLNELHQKAHKLCFIANSINCPVSINSTGKSI